MYTKTLSSHSTHDSDIQECSYQSARMGQLAYNIKPLLHSLDNDKIRRPPVIMTKSAHDPGKELCAITEKVRVI